MKLDLFHADVLLPTLLQSSLAVDIVALAAGDLHSLILRNDGVVLSFGFPESGALGHSAAGLSSGAAGSNSSTSNAYSPSSSSLSPPSRSSSQPAFPVANSDPSPVLFPTGVRALNIAAGAYHSLALCDDGKVYSWGDGTDGQLGPRGREQGGAGCGGGDVSNTTTTTTTTNNSSNDIDNANNNDDDKLPSEIDFTSLELLGLGVIASRGVSAGFCTSGAVGNDGSLYTWGSCEGQDDARLGRSSSVAAVKAILAGVQGGERKLASEDKEYLLGLGAKLPRKVVPVAVGEGGERLDLRGMALGGYSLLAWAGGDDEAGLKELKEADERNDAVIRERAAAQTKKERDRETEGRTVVWAENSGADALGDVRPHLLGWAEESGGGEEGGEKKKKKKKKKKKLLGRKEAEAMATETKKKSAVYNPVVAKILARVGNAAGPVSGIRKGGVKVLFS